jgi:hypothetical protein
MSRAISLARAIRLPVEADMLRAGIVWSCALALIAAGRAFPFL